MAKNIEVCKPVRPDFCFPMGCHIVIPCSDFPVRPFKTWQVSASFRFSGLTSILQRWKKRPPFTGVPRRPGLKVPHGVLFELFWAPASEWRVLFECFSAVLGPKKRQKALKKHSLGHSEAGAQNCSKSTPWGTFRPGRLGTPANGGRNRKKGGGFLYTFFGLFFVFSRWRTTSAM